MERYLFQFPSNGKVYPKWRLPLCWERVMESFNSLQTGKSIQRPGRTAPKQWRKRQVSIPFKRESLSKGWSHSKGVTSMAKFQFPSNGKVYPKCSWRVYANQTVLCFNSLQTGKSIQRGRLHRGWLQEKVSIPFKRESLSKVLNKTWLAKHCSHVSIPFKRESLSKVRRQDTWWSTRDSFNSLQTGKSIQRAWKSCYCLK